MLSNKGLDSYLLNEFDIELARVSMLANNNGRSLVSISYERNADSSFTVELIGDVGSRSRYIYLISKAKHPDIKLHIKEYDNRFQKFFKKIFGGGK